MINKNYLKEFLTSLHLINIISITNSTENINICLRTNECCPQAKSDYPIKIHSGFAKHKVNPDGSNFAKCLCSVF